MPAGFVSCPGRPTCVQLPPNLLGRKRVTAPSARDDSHECKIVPDPPRSQLGRTASTPFGACDAGHPAMFQVREGIAAEDALIHASVLLQGIYDTAQQACEHMEDLPKKGLLWSTLHSAEMAKGLIDAVLDGLEGRAATG